MYASESAENPENGKERIGETKGGKLALLYVLNYNI